MNVIIAANLDQAAHELATAYAAADAVRLKALNADFVAYRAAREDADKVADKVAVAKAARFTVAYETAYVVALRAALTEAHAAFLTSRESIEAEWRAAADKANAAYVAAVTA